MSASACEKVVDILDGPHDDNTKIKKLKDAYFYLKGGDKNIKKFQSEVQANKELQKQQLEAMMTLQQYARDNEGIRFRDKLIAILHDGGFVEYLVRYLQLDINNEEEYKFFRKFVPWKAGKYFGLEIMSLLMDAPDTRPYDERLKSNKLDVYVETGIYQQLYECFKALGDDDMLLFFPLAEILTSVGQNCNTGLYTFFSTEIFQDLARFLYKDSATEYIYGWYKRHDKTNPLERWETQVLEGRAHGCFGVPLRSHHSTRNHMEIVQQWGINLRDSVLRAMIRINYHSDERIVDSIRKIIMTDQKVMKSLFWWLHTISVSEDDLIPVKFSWCVINTLSEAPWALEELFMKHNLMKYVETLLYSPHIHVATKISRILYYGAKYGGETRKMIVSNEYVMKAMINLSYSFVDSLITYSVKCIKFVTRTPENVGKLEKMGFGIREVITLLDYYPMKSCCCDMVKIKHNIEITKHWRSQVLGILGAKYNFDRERATMHVEKAIGEVEKGNYERALELLRYADICVSPSIASPRSNLIEWNDYENHDCEKIRGDFPYENYISTPAEIRVVRAKCYMKMKEWKKALTAANDAMAKLYETTDMFQRGKTAVPIMTDLLRMRTRILTELNMPLRALQDASFLCAYDREKKQENLHHWENFQWALLEYESKHGYNLLNRCSMCFKGDGIPQMQCYKCGALYCSTKCQEKAWENGHKEFCQIRWKKLHKSPHKNMIPACRDQREIRSWNGLDKDEYHRSMDGY